MEINSNDRFPAAETSSTFDVAPSFEKKKSQKINSFTLTFHYDGCLIEILIMAYCNPYITG